MYTALYRKTDQHLLHIAIAIAAKIQNVTIHVLIALTITTVTVVEFAQLF